MSSELRPIGDILDDWIKRDRWHLERAGYRISKAIVNGQAKYTAWKKGDSGWDVVGVHDRADEAKAAVADLGLRARRAG
jgi:hypothetical protein